MPITQDNLDNWFTYHAPTSEQLLHYEAIRNAAGDFARVIVDHTPPSADQSAAIRLIREATMTANASVACGGR